MNQFIHAKVLALYALDASESKTPWDKWQYNRGRGWADAVGPLVFSEDTQYRRKPSTLTILGVEFEWEPVSFEEWKEGATCYAPNLGVVGGGLVTYDGRSNPITVKSRAKQGLLCRTREQAIAFANAITKGYYKND